VALDVLKKRPSNYGAEPLALGIAVSSETFTPSDGNADVGLACFVPVGRQHWLVAVCATATY